MQDNVISNETLKNIANAIKEILPDTETIKLKDFPAKIKELPKAIKENYLSYHPLKTVTGNSIQLNDVCELPHKIKCEATKNNSNLIVTTAGVNLLTGNENQEKRNFFEYK